MDGDKMKFLEMLKDDKKMKLVMVVGITGIILIALTTFLPKKSTDTPEVSLDEKTTAAYEAEIEKAIAELVASIDGVGKSKIMVTLKNGVEYVYAKEEKQNSDTTNGSGSDQTVQQRDNYEQKTILVEDSNGRKTALIKTTLEPTVKGVVVVCEGGDDILVQQRVTDAVKTALGIGANNVCVTKLTLE